VANSYRQDAERRYREGEWAGKDLAQPCWFTLGPCGYLAIGLIRLLLAPKGGELVLDVGGGRGVVLSYLLRDGAAVGVLTDIAFDPLGDYPGLRVACDAVALPFTDGSFPKVITSDLLEHLYPRDLPTVFSELSRVVAPGGRVVVHTSCYGWSLRRLGAKLSGKGLGRLDGHDLKDGHHNRLTGAELVHLARAAGLTLERAYYYKHLFQPLARMAKTLLLGGRGQGGGDGGRARGLKEAGGLRGRLLRLLACSQVLLSSLDVLFFGRIPGGAIVAGFKKKK
jgi:SAM-dependent methyltransferase